MPFQRNGSWYDGSDARAHLQRKYDYLLKKGMVDSAEQFIERAASQSSMSGNPTASSVRGSLNRPQPPGSAHACRPCATARRRHGGSVESSHVRLPCPFPELPP